MKNYFKAWNVFLKMLFKTSISTHNFWWSGVFWSSCHLNFFVGSSMHKLKKKLEKIIPNKKQHVWRLFTWNDEIYWVLTDCWVRRVLLRWPGIISSDKSHKKLEFWTDSQFAIKEKIYCAHLDCHIWIYNSKLVKSKIVLDNGLLILLSELLAKISKQNNHSRYFDKSSKTKFSVETFTSKGGEKKIKLVDTIYDTIKNVVYVAPILDFIRSSNMFRNISYR